MAKIDIHKARDIANRAEKVLSEEFEGNYTVETKRGTYDQNTFTLTINFSLPDFNADEDSWKNHARSYGLTEQDYGKWFRYQGEFYQLCSINPRASKYPFVVKRRPDAKMFKFPADLVKQCLKTEEALECLTGAKTD